MGFDWFNSFEGDREQASQLKTLKENAPVFESVEHKPDSEGEYERIKNAGHYESRATS